MIAYATWPGNIAQWDRERDQLFYLEVFGDVSPRMTHGYTQLPPPEGSQGSAHRTNIAPLFEYYWSLGYIDLDGECGPESWGGGPEDTAAEVYLYFPTTGGWRIEELLATIKYLCPGKEHASLLQEAAHLFATAQPIVEDASKLAAIGRMLPGVGPLAASTATLLDVIARLKVTSVPPAAGYEWSVQKVTEHVQGEGLLHGIKWTIPKKFFIEFGSRLTGSIAVNIVPSIPQHLPEEPGQSQPRQLPIRARADMHLHPRPADLLGVQADTSFPLPGDRQFLELEIEPQA